MINLEKQIQKICVATNGVTTLKLEGRSRGNIES